MRNSLVAEFEGYKWAMEPIRLKSFIEHAAKLQPSEAVEQISVAGKEPQARIEGATAIIPISGVLLKTVPKWIRFWGFSATGYDEIRQMVGAAADNKAVSGIHLQIDSPGGQVDGLVEAADAIFAARDEKTVTATIEDLGASAAYWLASQAETIEAGRNTEVGSIGVYTVYVDYSKFADDLGAKVIVIRSGEHKGMGVMGAEITDEQVAAVQKIIDAMADNFIGAVAAGRGKSTDAIRELATGQLWIAAAALELGLIDSVSQAPAGQTSEGVKSANQQVSDNGKASDSKGDSQMDEKEIKAAVSAAEDRTATAERGRLADIKDACGGDLEFAVAAWERGLSALEAKAEYADVLTARLAERDKQQAAETGAKGAKALETGGSDDAGDGDFLAEARELAADKSITVTAAMKRLARSKPGLHAAFRQKCQAGGSQMYAEAV